MSKIGQKSIEVASAVQIQMNGNQMTVKGGKGEISITLPDGITVEQQDGTMLVKRSNDSKKMKALHGLYRSLIYNAVFGVDKGWQRRLEIQGTGFNVKLQGTDLVFKMGYSHPVVYKTLPGITFQVEGNNKVVVNGADKQLVGQVAYQIKMIRKPDAYKGKGIRYEGERIKLKAGKKAKTA